MSRVVTENPGMIEYPKIETLFERDKKTFVVNPDLLKSPVLATIKEWDVTEKIDGTNIRVALTPEGRVVYGGRTAAALLGGRGDRRTVPTRDRSRWSLWTRSARMERKPRWVGRIGGLKTR